MIIIWTATIIVADLVITVPYYSVVEIGTL